MIRQLAPGMVQQMQSVCSDCNGEGMRASTCFVLDWVGDTEIRGVYHLFSLKVYLYSYCRKVVKEINKH